MDDANRPHCSYSATFTVTEGTFVRRYFLTAVPMMLLLSLLTGCGGKEMSSRRWISEQAAECEQYSFTADLTANYDDRVYDFTLECVGTPSGDMSMTVTAPDTISGISAIRKERLQDHRI